MTFTHGDQITKTNIGPTGTLTPFTGTISAVDGQIIENLEITGSPAINVKAGAQVIIRNCRLIGLSTTAAAGYTLKATAAGGLYVQVEDCEIITRYAQTKSIAMSGDGHISVKRTVLRGGTDDVFYSTPPNSPGVIATGDSRLPLARVLMEECWVGDQQFFTGAHNDGIQIDGGGYTCVRRCYISGFRMAAGADPLTTSATETTADLANSALITTQNSSNPSQISYVVLENSYVNGGNYTVYMTAPDGLPMNHMFMTGNKFGLVFRFGHLRFDDTDATSARSGNTWAASGTTSSGLVVTAGQSIPGESANNSFAIPRIGQVSGTRKITATGGIGSTPVYKSKTTSTANSGTAPSITLPNTGDGAAIGQLGILVLTTPGTVTSPDPAGWDPLPGTPTTPTASGGHFRVWTKKLISGDLGAILTFTLTASSRSALACITTTPASLGPGAFDTNETNTSGTSVVAPVVDPATNQDLLVTIHGVLSNTAGDQPTWTADTATTERVDITSTSATLRNATILIATQSLTLGSPTSAKTATSSLAVQRQGVTLALSPLSLVISSVGEPDGTRGLTAKKTKTLGRIGMTARARQLPQYVTYARYHADWQDGIAGGTYAGQEFFDQLESTIARHDTQLNRFQTVGAVVRVLDGVPSDLDFTSTPPDGTLVANSVANALYIRLGGTWRLV